MENEKKMDAPPSVDDRIMYWKDRIIKFFLK